MELSPEEKKRIYEEEKVRLEAQEKAKRELKAKKTRLRSNWAFMGCLLAFSLVAMPLLAHSIDLTARSGIDSGNGCRYEGTTKREFLAAETICLGWGAIGVKQAKADGNTPASLNNLAGLYNSQGKYAEAELLYMRSLAIKEKVFGPDHPGVAVVCKNMAELYRKIGKKEEADKLEERADRISSIQ